MNWKHATLTAVAATLVAAAAHAQQTQPPQQPAGMGHGMMGQGVRGQGMMGPGMMGPGMMGSMGMMEDHGACAGMMDGMGGSGLAPIMSLDLSASQRAQVFAIGDELRRSNWSVLGTMQDEMARLRDARLAGKRDNATILAAYRRISDLRLKMLENTLEARDKAEGLLTPQQRQEAQRFGPN